VNGHIMSSMSLGYRFLNGYGAPKDCERALMFYKVRSDIYSPISHLHWFVDC
jgi:hypothetical protein